MQQGEEATAAGADPESSVSEVRASVPRVRRQQQPVGEWLVPSNMSLIIEVRVISHVARQARTPCPFPFLPILPLTRSAVARFVSAAPCGVPCGNSDACHRFCIVCILDSIALEWLSVCVCVLPTPLLPPALTTTRQSALSISNFQLNIHSLSHSLIHTFTHAVEHLLINNEFASSCSRVNKSSAICDATGLSSGMYNGYGYKWN